MRLRKVGQVHGLQVPSIVIDSTGDVDSVPFVSAIRAGSPRTLSTVLPPRRHSMVGCSRDYIPQSKYPRELQDCAEVIV